MKVLVTARLFGNVSDTAFKIFVDSGHELLENPFRGKGLSENELVSLIGEADALLTGVDQVTARVMDSAPDLKVISKFGTGVDNIDVAAATERGIVVTKVPGTNSDAVADMAMALMLALARNLPQAWDSVRRGEWPLIVGADIHGKTLGLIGLGQIGRRVAVRARGFDMEVLACETAPDLEFVKESGVTLTSLQDLLDRSDFVSIHVPLTNETRNFIGRAELSRMIPTAYLVNTARGGLVDEEALYDALMNQRIAGAAFDVFATEPTTNRKLLDLPNFMGTPHMGAFTREALENVEAASARNIISVLDDKRPAFVVNPQVYVSGIKKNRRKGP